MATACARSGRGWASRPAPSSGGSRAPGRRSLPSWPTHERRQLAPSSNAAPAPARPTSISWRRSVRRSLNRLRHDDRCDWRLSAAWPPRSRSSSLSSRPFPASPHLRLHHHQLPRPVTADIRTRPSTAAASNAAPGSHATPRSERPRSWIRPAASSPPVGRSRPRHSRCCSRHQSRPRVLRTASLVERHPVRRSERVFTLRETSEGWEARRPTTECRLRRIACSPRDRVALSEPIDATTVTASFCPIDGLEAPSLSPNPSRRHFRMRWAAVAT